MNLLMLLNDMEKERGRWGIGPFQAPYSAFHSSGHSKGADEMCQRRVFERERWTEEHGV